MKLKYIPYFFSYLFVYPFAFPFLVIATIASGTPDLPNFVNFLILFSFYVCTTILSAWSLNRMFRGIAKLKKNTKYSRAIFILHLVLIPLTYIYVVRPVFLK